MSGCEWVGSRRSRLSAGMRLEDEMMLTPLDEDNRRALAEKSFMAAAAEVRPILPIPCCTHCH